MKDKGQSKFPVVLPFDNFLVCRRYLMDAKDELVGDNMRYRPYLLHRDVPPYEAIVFVFSWRANEEIERKGSRFAEITIEDCVDEKMVPLM